MSAALRLARQMAAKDLSWIEAVIHDGQREQRINAAKATLDAIDAAIAAEAPAKDGLTDVSIDLGDGQAVVLEMSAADAKRLMGSHYRSRRVRPFAGWSEQELRPAISALEDALAKAALNRVDLEIDLSRQSIRIGGDGLDVAKVAAFLLEQGKDLATGGIAGADFKPGLVGEQPSGASALFSGYVDRKSLGEEVDKKEWSVYGAAPTSIDPVFDLGDCVRVDTKGSGPVSEMSAIGIVVEIGRIRTQRTYRMDFPHGFGLQDSFFTAADLTRINRPDWL